MTADCNVTFCCQACPHQPTCADLNEAAFARPEEISGSDT